MALLREELCSDASTEQGGIVDMTQITGRVAIVMGGGRGLGRAIWLVSRDSDGMTCDEMANRSGRQGSRRSGDRSGRLAIPLILATHGDIGCLDQGRDAVAYLKPHVVHGTRGDDCGNVADSGLHDDLAQHLVRDYLLYGARYFVAN